MIYYKKTRRQFINWFQIKFILNILVFNNNRRNQSQQHTSKGKFPIYTSAASRFSQNMNLIIEASEDGGAIYLGNLEAASNVEYLKHHNIGAVLTVAGGTGLHYNTPDIKMHEIINADDALYQDLSQYFNKILNFIESARKKTNILIHCFAGISRSVTAICTYIMKKNGWTYERTISHVRSKRNIANPNPSFVKQLKRFESQIKQQQHGQYGTNNQFSSQILYSSAPSQTPTVNRSRQVQDDHFDSTPKRAASSYGTHKSSYPSQINSVHSNSSLSTQQTNSLSINRALFNPQTNHYPINNNYNYQYVKQTSPSPAFSQAYKNNHQVIGVQSSQQFSHPSYSRLVY